MKKKFAEIFTFICLVGVLHADSMPTNDLTAIGLSKDKSFITLVNTTLKYHARENKVLLTELFFGKKNLIKSSTELKEKLSEALGYSSVKEFIKCETKLKRLRQNVTDKYPEFSFDGTNELTRAAIKEGVKNKQFNIPVLYNDKSDRCDFSYYGSMAACMLLDDNNDVLACWDFFFDVWIYCQMTSG